METKPQFCEIDERQWQRNYSCVQISENCFSLLFVHTNGMKICVRESKTHTEKETWIKWRMNGSPLRSIALRLVICDFIFQN